MPHAAFNADFERAVKALGLGPDVEGFTLTWMRSEPGRPGEIRLRVAHAAHIASPRVLVETVEDFDVILRKRLPG